MLMKSMKKRLNFCEFFRDSFDNWSLFMTFIMLHRTLEYKFET